MTYRGRVQGGVIVLSENVELPDGTEVRVEPVSEPAVPSSKPSLSETLLKFAGKAKGLPSDAARNHDHYLYGTPKR